MRGVRLEPQDVEGGNVEDGAASSSNVSNKSITQKQQQTQKQRQKQMRLRTPSWAQSTAINTTATKTYLYSII